MRSLKFFTVCIVLFFIFFPIACEFEGGISSNKSFDLNLRGTWESEKGSIFEGSKIEITYGTIKISGYTEKMAIDAELDDAKRPFIGIAKGYEYNGYSEEGKIFIENSNEGIPYTYSAVGPYPQTKMLKFDFGGRQETLILDE